MLRAGVRTCKRSHVQAQRARAGPRTGFNNRGSLFAADDIQQNGDFGIGIFECQSARDAAPVVCSNNFGGNGATKSIRDVRVIVDDGGVSWIGVAHDRRGNLQVAPPSL